MSKVKMINKDNTESVYNVEYPTAYVTKVLSVEHDNLANGGTCKIKSIYVDDVITAHLDSTNTLGYVSPGDTTKHSTKSNESGCFIIDIPSTEYTISSTAGGVQVIYYK